jgi:hypothetical protein
MSGMIKTNCMLVLMRRFCFVVNQSVQFSYKIVIMIVMSYFVHEHSCHVTNADSGDSEKFEIQNLLVEKN